MLKDHVLRARGSAIVKWQSRGVVVVSQLRKKPTFAVLHLKKSSEDLKLPCSLSCLQRTSAQWNLKQKSAINLKVPLPNLRRNAIRKDSRNHRSCLVSKDPRSMSISKKMRI